jgi:plastocyanin
MTRLAFVVLAALVAASCGESLQTSDAAAQVPADAGAAVDAATPPAPDSGALGEPDASDSQPGLDAAVEGADATTAALDAAAMPPDAAAPGPDAGSENGCAPQFAGCATYVDATAEAANRTVAFSSFQYSPKCLQVAAGQSVTFSGSFSFHPLKQACGPAPVITATSTGSSKSFVFTDPGEYGYFCSAHGSAAGTGMAGSILVQ